MPPRPRRTLAMISFRLIPALTAPPARSAVRGLCRMPAASAQDAGDDFFPVDPRADGPPDAHVGERGLRLIEGHAVLGAVPVGLTKHDAGGALDLPVDEGVDGPEVVNRPRAQRGNARRLVRGEGVLEAIERGGGR